MTDNTLLDSSYTETVARKLSDSRNRSSNILELLDDRRQSSRKSALSARDSSIEPRRDNSQVMIPMSEHKESEPKYDAGTDDRQKFGLEERLARDRIKHLHDVFVSAQGGEGLSMEEFRSAMRQVFSEEHGRRVEDDELDKVPAAHIAVIPVYMHVYR